jgi:geranylgeranyl diphosphate synthase, type II
MSQTSTQPDARSEARDTLARLSAPAQAVDRFVADYLKQRPLPGNLRGAVEYALLGGGKRMRPTLVVRSCEAVGGKLKAALPASAAIELIHCFSLVHDDLPAMDDDDLRRGRPTLHKHAGEAMAILGGDLMMGLAFEIIGTSITRAELATAVSRELALATNDMIAGQVYDTLPDFEASVEPLERLLTIHRHKTGALIRCSCRMGALCGGADARQLDALTHYAEAVGLMFQVVDDLLDVTQTTEQLGKKAGKDQSKGKLTYPGLLGVATSRAEVENLAARAHEALDSLEQNGLREGVDTTALRELCDYMAVRCR